MIPISKRNTIDNGLNPKISANGAIGTINVTRTTNGSILNDHAPFCPLC